MALQNVEIFVELNDNDLETLNFSSLDLEEALREAGIQANIRYSVPPDRLNSSDRTKSTVLTIVASAGLVMAVGQAISGILRTFQNRPRLVEYFEIVELSKDSESSETRYERIKRFDLLQPAPDGEKSKGSVSVTKSGGFVLKIENGNK